ncbi:MAG TPA: CHRD domain-containing protein [Chloroflexia bacterium]|nr:CHRD domain-containing protein [Chloroflexia bacterium]
MRKLRFLALFLLGLLVIAGQASASSGGGQFRTTLLGSNEVPPRDTDAHGSAQYHVANDGLSVSYKLNLVNIDNIVAGHIHLAPAGVNGPVVVNLVSASACRTLPNGMQCSGTFTAANLVGPLAGHPLSDLLTAMEEGRTYTNVHTTQFPGGEIRGQNRHGGN